MAVARVSLSVDEDVLVEDQPSSRAAAAPDNDSGVILTGDPRDLQQLSVGQQEIVVRAL